MTTRTRAAPAGKAWLLWLPGFLVALGAGAATAHGLFEVAAAASVPKQIAWIYPLITDGLALVAYGATAQLEGSARHYAWAVVVLAAGLSGLAQASYLAGGVSAPPVLRFGVKMLGRPSPPRSWRTFCSSSAPTAHRRPGPPSTSRPRPSNPPPYNPSAFNPFNRPVFNRAVSNRSPSKRASTPSVFNRAFNRSR